MSKHEANIELLVRLPTDLRLPACTCHALLECGHGWRAAMHLEVVGLVDVPTAAMFGA